MTGESYVPRTLPGGAEGRWEEQVEVDRGLLYRTLDFVLARATQNHKLHQDWNEGAGDFAACTRGDCAEARALLSEWDPGCR